MSQKIEIRCNQCGHLLFKKIVNSERKGEREYGGVEIKCDNCKAINVIAVKHELPPYGERLGYSKKAS